MERKEIDHRESQGRGRKSQLMQIADRFKVFELEDMIVGPRQLEEISRAFMCVGRGEGGAIPWH